MKFTANRFNALLFSLFIIGMMAVAYLLFNFPGDLEHASIKIDNKVLEDIRPVLWKINLVTAATLLLGVGTLFITIFILNSNVSTEKIVYRDRIESDFSASGGAQEDRHEDQTAEVRQVGHMMDGEKDWQSRAGKWLSAICRKLEASQAALYVVSAQKRKKIIKMQAAYALNASEGERVSYEMGEGLVGQVAKSGRKLYIDDVPGGYVKIISGLGSGSPRYLLLLPLIEGKDVIAVTEIASFTEISDGQMALVEKAYELLRKDLLTFLKGPEDEKKKQNRNSNSKKSK